MYATADRLHYIAEGTSSKYVEHFLPQSEDPPENCLVLTRWDKYNLLLSRIKEGYGKLDPKELQAAIRQPVAHPSNLHNVIFFSFNS